MTMNKINWIKTILTIVKYGITLVLGYLGGSEDIVSNIVNL